MNLKTFLILFSFTLILIHTHRLDAEEMPNSGMSGSENSLAAQPVEKSRWTGSSSESARDHSGSFFQALAGRFGFSVVSGMDSGLLPSRKEIKKTLKPHLGSIIDTIIVTGNSSTRPKTIIREMASRQGEKLDDKLVFRDTSYLRGLGFFSAVEIRVEQCSPGRCRVEVHVEERSSLFMKYPLPIANYDIDKGLSLGIRWRVKNFRGVGEDLLITFEERPTRERGGAVTWYAPWVGGCRLKLSTRIFNYVRIKEPDGDDFIKDRNGGRVSVGLPLTRNRVKQVWLTPSFSLEGRLSRLSIEGNVNEPAGVWMRQLLISFGMALSYDSRDNYIAPMRGYLTAFSVNRYSSVHGHKQQYAFYRFISNLYIPVRDKGTLIFAIDADNRDGDLPSFYSMRLGGKTELRGFTGDYRGRSRVVGSLQWRKRIYGPVVFRVPVIGRFDLAINGVVFTGIGALMDCFDDLVDSRFYTSGGFGFEFLSPLQDIIRVECAVSEESDPVFYITSNTQF